MVRKGYYSLLCALIGAMQPYAVLASDSNSSGISVQIVARDQTKGTKKEICQGAVPKNVDLNQIGLSPTDLKNGVECVSGDFDSNGSLDFMLYGSYIRSENRRYSLVLFYKGATVLKTQLIPGTLEVFKKSDPERSKYPKYLNSFGLIKHAEGDRGVVYFYDSKKGQFKKVPYIYPNGYEMGD